MNSNISCKEDGFVGLWRENFHLLLGQYEQQELSFVPHLLPSLAIEFGVFQTLEILQKRLGTSTLIKSLNPDNTTDSPLKGRFGNSHWLKTANVVGINVRTIGSFWNIINYALTLPQCHDTIHLLPIWEPGVVSSLYGKVSWNINSEFFDPQLHWAIPTLDTVEKQLKVTINILHALGKKVGLDVIPHTDRFSEIVITHPRLFEWVRQKNGTIIDHSENVWEEVEDTIWRFVHQYGAADGSPISFGKEVLFSPDVPLISDTKRQSILFGSSQQQRLARRLQIIEMLTDEGLETLPMTMAPPYRGLHINANEFVTDERGTRWYQYEFDNPQGMSRVFGPLARYRFYHSKNNNQNWELDFDNPQVVAWQYFCRKYQECQQQYNFDFMRGDMAHVQMRATGVPTQIDEYYDPLRAVKRHIQHKGTPYFAFYAETFLAPPDTMGYGDELAHLEAIEADVTLGDLQSTVITSVEFSERFKDYINWLQTCSFAPSFTIITADKDDPRFDEFYHKGNLVRYFMGLFLTQMPSYYSLGFELRNLHETRGKNEEYSKLYVFQITNDSEQDKVTHGKFQWGENEEQFASIMRLRLFAESIWSEISHSIIKWVTAPNTNTQLLAWTLNSYTPYLFVVNLDANLAMDINHIVAHDWQKVFDTDTHNTKAGQIASLSAQIYLQ